MASPPESPAPPRASSPRTTDVWRIRRRSTFEGFRRARRGRAGAISVSWTGGSSSDGVHGVEPPQVAYSIGRRVGPAVVRNRIRRRLRTIVRELAPSIPPGAYLIGVAPAAANASYHELRTMVPRAIAKATAPR